MPSIVYTARLASFYGDASTAPIVWTVDDQFAYVLRDILFTNLGSTTAPLELWIQAGPSRYDLFHQTSVAAGTSEHLELRQRILSSEQLRLFSPASSCSLLVTGYRLLN